MPQSKHAGFPVFRRPLFGYGIKVLFDDTETDFVFDSPLPLVWQRSYYSDQIGNGWDKVGRCRSPCVLSGLPTVSFILMGRAGKFRCRISATKRKSLIPRPTKMKTIYMRKRPHQDLLPPKKIPTVWMTPISILTNKSSFHRFQTTSTKSPHPTDWYPATNTTATTPTAKCSKAATTSVKNGRLTTAKTILSLPILTIRQLRPLGTGMQLDQRRRRKSPTNLLLPL